MRYKRVRATYHAMNSETDFILDKVIKAAEMNGYNLNNTVILFVSDHGEMAMEHRQILKNSMYEASVRIPLFFAGRGIKTGVLVRNLTQSIDLLPTLIELGGGNVPQWLSGTSLMPFLKEGYNVTSKRRDYVTSQYHSNLANTGVFMVRKGEWKYIQYGHYLKAFENYIAQLFNIVMDPDEIDNVVMNYREIVDEMEIILRNEYDYEMIDCVAKQNDFKVFEEFYWDKYNQSELYKKFEKNYHGFDDNDWQSVINWRNELLSKKQCVFNV